jgi:hypothetical protein
MRIALRVRQKLKEAQGCQSPNFWINFISPTKASLFIQKGIIPQEPEAGVTEQTGAEGRSPGVRATELGGAA